jgi:hypothetical protein
MSAGLNKLLRPLLRYDVTSPTRYLFATVAVCAIAACSSGPDMTSQTRVPAAQAASPDWVVHAESDTKAFLMNMCLELAPVEEMDRGSKEMTECLAKSSIALEETWRPIMSRATSDCVQTGQRCCLDRMPANYLEAKARLENCNAACARALGHEPTARSCSAIEVVTPPEPAAAWKSVQIARRMCRAGDAGPDVCRNVADFHAQFACDSLCKLDMKKTTTTLSNDEAPATP